MAPNTQDALFKTNPIRGRLNSFMFKVLSGYLDHLFGKSKRSLFHNHPDTVIEIGPGAGANMRYLRKGTKLIAFEPNIHMHKNLLKCAKKHEIDLTIKATMGESVDLPDSSCEFVIGTLVLCTVNNPELCLHQIKRILKPSGEFVFIEHVKARDASMLAFFQKLVHKPWHWFFEGCHTNRDTKSLLESSGFSSLQLEQYNLYSPFVPIIPQIRGKAIK